METMKLVLSCRCSVVVAVVDVAWMGWAEFAWLDGASGGASFLGCWVDARSPEAFRLSAVTMADVVGGWDAVTSVEAIVRRLSWGRYGRAITRGWEKGLANAMQ